MKDPEGTVWPDPPEWEFTNPGSGEPEVNRCICSARYEMITEEDKETIRKIISDVMDEKLMSVALGALVGLLIGVLIANVF